MKISEPKKSNDMPVTKHMLDSLRGEIKSEIVSLRLNTETRFDSIELEFKKLRSEVKTDISQLRSEVKSDISQLRSEVKTDISGVKSDIAKVLAAVHRVSALVEEQNVRNKYVLDGYAQVYDKVQELEQNKADKIESI